MADSPWNKNPLSKGQVIQKLEAMGCVEVKRHRPTSSMWKAPTGHYFSFSYENCYAEDLQGIVDKILKWAEESRPEL